MRGERRGRDKRKEGEDVIVVPAVSTEDAVKKFPKGVKIVKPYLRYTPQPNK